MDRYKIFCFVCLISVLCAGVSAQKRELRVSSFNVRNDTNTSDAAAGNGWSKRYPYIANAILFHDLDIIGTQECVEHQVRNLIESLPGYAYVGVGRDDGVNQGEYSAIFYNTERLELLDKGNFWLSDTPEQPGKGWDAAMTRICSWGRFKVKGSGFEFFMFNLHMDHIGKKARVYSSELVLYQLENITEGKPAIITGDFNLNQMSDSYKILSNSCVVEDSYNLAPIKYAPNGTMSDFNVNNITESRIDHVFVTSDFVVKRYGILTDIYWDASDGEGSSSGNFPEEVEYVTSKARCLSDHFPVVVGLDYNE